VQIGWQRKMLHTRASLRPIRRIGWRNWLRNGRLRKMNDRMQLKIGKLMLKMLLHSLS